MNSRKALFVGMDISKTLNELGFDDPCFGYYDRFFAEVHLDNNGGSKICNNPIPAPLWQQVVDWLIAKHKIYVSVVPYTDYTFDGIRFELLLACQDNYFDPIKGNSSVRLAKALENKETSTYRIYKTYNDAMSDGIMIAIDIIKKKTLTK